MAMRDKRQRGEDKRHRSVRKVLQSILTERLAAAGYASLSKETILLWGEVIETRHFRPQLCLRDKEFSSRRLWVNLPPRTALPADGDMVCVEGTLSLRIDEEEGALSLELEGRSVVENRGPSRRFQEQRRALDEIASERSEPLPLLDCALKKVALVSSQHSQGREDFEAILKSKVPHGLSIEPFFVNLTDAQSIADGITRAGQSGADLIVLTRGGGSTENLEPFNEPAVGRALVRLTQPAMVAIGHTCNSVASERFVAYTANTPTHAAYKVCKLFFQHQRRDRTPYVEVGSRRAPLPIPAQVVSHGTERRELRAEPPRTAWSSESITQQIFRWWQRTFPRVHHAFFLLLRWTIAAVLAVVFFGAGWQGALFWNGPLESSSPSVAPTPSAPSIPVTEPPVSVKRKKVVQSQPAKNQATIPTPEPLLPEVPLGQPIQTKRPADNTERFLEIEL